MGYLFGTLGPVTHSWRSSSTAAVTAARNRLGLPPCVGGGHRLEGFLWGLELLGNKEAAPGILKALGCMKGRFRTPGKDQPFAMYLPLTETAEKPAYFGLAFD